MRPGHDGTRTDAYDQDPLDAFDAVIADYQMPIMNGLEFLRSVRSQGNPIPFILFTGKGREEVVIEAMNSGADFYIQKGGDPKSQFTELDHKIRQAVRRQRAEQNLKKSEQNYRTVFESTSDEITLHDPFTGEIVDANRAATAGWKCASLEDLRDSWHQGESVYASENYLAMLRKTVEEGPQTFESFIPNRLGEAFWQEVRLDNVVIGGRSLVMAF
jgi:PAS domain S-box-containing protein